MIEFSLKTRAERILKNWVQKLIMQLGHLNIQIVNEVRIFVRYDLNAANDIK